MIRSLLVLAVVGLVGSVLWHVMSLVGRVTEISGPGLVLVIGLFVVLFPAFWIGVKRARGRDRTEPWQAMLGASAKWGEPLMCGTMMYVFVVSVIVQRTRYFSWLGPASRTQVVISGGWLMLYLIAVLLLRPALGAQATGDAKERDERH